MDIVVNLELRRGDEPLEGPWTLEQLDLRESLDRPYLAMLEVAVAHPAPRSTSLIGTRLELDAVVQGIGMRLLGVVTEASYVRTFRARDRLRLRVEPALAALALQQRTRLFCDATPQQIVRDLCAPALTEFGGSMSDGALEGLEVRDYTAQRGETDLELLSRVLADDAVAWCFSHEGDEEHVTLLRADHRWCDADHDPHLPFAPDPADGDHAVVRLRRSADLGIRRSKTHAWQWQDATPRTLRGEASPDPSARSFGEVDVHVPARLRETMAGAAIDRTQLRAQLCAGRARARSSTLEGRSNSPHIRAGAGFEVEAHPDPEVPSQMYATRVVHLLERVGQEDDGAYRYHNQFEALPSDCPYIPPPRRAAPALGPETAIVVGDPKSPDCTDEHGRVRVRFAWADDQPSCPVRVAQTWAGSGFGACFVPRPGMEVVVSYLDGDAEQPLVTGCVYNGANTPPLSLPRDRARSTLRTQSYPDGSGSNELWFDDQHGRERVALRARRRLDMCARGSTFQSTGGNREIHVGRDNDGNREGALNTFVHGDTNDVVGGSRYTQAQAEAHDEVQLSRTVRTGGDHQLSVGGRHFVDAGESLVQTSGTVRRRGSEVVLEGTETVRIRGSSIAIEATNELSLSVQGNHISLLPFEQGIVIQGEQTYINCPDKNAKIETRKGEDEELEEGFKPMEAYRASCSTARGGGGGGSRPRRTNEARQDDPHFPRPYWPPPVRKTKKKPGPKPKPKPKPGAGTCIVEAITISCKHGRKIRYSEAAAGAGKPLEFEVVPSEGSDTVTLAVDQGDGCAEPTWKAGSTVLPPGLAATVNMPDPMIEIPTSLTAKDDLFERLRPTTVVATLGDGTQKVINLRAYPSKRIDVDLDLPFERYKDDLLGPLYENFPEAKELLEDAFDELPVRPKPKHAFVRFDAGFDEHTDERVFFGYLLHLAFVGTLEIDLPLPAAKAIRILNRVLKHAKFLRKYKVLETLGKLDCDGNLYIKNTADIEALYEKAAPSPSPIVKPQISHAKADISIGVELSGKVPLKLPFKVPKRLFGFSPPKFDDPIEVGIDVSFDYSFLGAPVLSTDELSIRGKWTVKDVKLNKAYLKSPLGDFDIKDKGLLSQVIDPSKLSIDINPPALPLKWIFEGRFPW